MASQELALGRGTEEVTVLGSTQEQHPRQVSAELYRLVYMYINIYVYMYILPRACK